MASNNDKKAFESHCRRCWISCWASTCGVHPLGGGSLTWMATLSAIVAVLLVAPAAWAAPKFKVIHAFGNTHDGAGTWGSLLLDKKGDLYGTTTGGGFFGWGTAFRLSPRSNGEWTETILHSFDRNGYDGYESTANLTFDAQGNLYGTTAYGGTYDAGTVFELVRGAGEWTEKILYSFGTLRNDGFEPYAGVVVSPTGSLFGTTPHDPGNVFELTPGSDGWSESVLDDFSRQRHDGNGPFAGVILDPDGNLYGTTEYGGVHNAGVVYELMPKAGGEWKERVLYDFCPAGPPNCRDGATPGVGVPAMDRSGNVYATTAGGGCCGGTIFKLVPHADGQWEHDVLYEFKGGNRGFGPGAGVVRDKAGNLYGTTIYGGKYGNGVVYELSPEKNGKWKYTVLHTFIYSDGAQPDANLILDDKGNLYGTAATGGEYGDGVAFELTP